MSKSIDSPRTMTGFLIIWFGQLISLVGSGMTSFALGVWVLEQTGQAAPFTIIMMLAVLPRILLAPLAGSLADRWNRRRMMILADTGNALVTLATALLLFSGRLAVWHVWILSPLGAAFGTLQSPAYAASIIMLVPKDNLARANGLMQMGQAIRTLLSPLLAGLLFELVGMEGIALIDFATYFFAIGALLLVHIPQPPQMAAGAPGSTRSVSRDSTFGWRYLRQRGGLFNLTLYAAAVNFGLNFAVALMAPLVMTFGTAETLGFLRALIGFGMLAGSITASVWGGPRHRIPGMVGFIAVGSLGLLFAGTRPTGGVIGGGMFVLAFCIPLANGLSQTVLQTKIEPAVQGRVMAVLGMLSSCMMPIAFLTSGPLADYVFEPWMEQGGPLGVTLIGQLIGSGPGRGIGLLFVISGAALFLLSGAVFAHPRTRRVEEELPDVVAAEQVQAFH